MGYIGNPLVSMDYPVDYFTGDGTSTIYQLSRTPGSATAILVYVNGIKKNSSPFNPEYYLDDSRLIFVLPPANSSIIEVTYLGLLAQVNVPNSQTILPSMLAANFNLPERIVIIPTANTVTINTDVCDVALQNNTELAGTLTINAPTGTPTDGQRFVFRLISTNVQTLSWNSIFAGSTDLVLPTSSTGGSKTDYLGFIYNSSASEWQLLAKVFGF